MHLVDAEFMHAGGSYMTFNLDILARVDAALGEALETAKTVQALIGDFDAKSAKLALGSLPEHARPPPAACLAI